MFGKGEGGGGKIMSKNGLEIMDVTDGQTVIRRDTTVGNYR
jgi:hypothetical protein